MAGCCATATLASRSLSTSPDIPPQSRIFPFKNDKPIDPNEVKLVVELHRFGGRVDTINYKKEGDYLMGDKVVEEPHSFDVKVMAEHTTARNRSGSIRPMKGA